MSEKNKTTKSSYKKTRNQTSTKRVITRRNSNKSPKKLKKQTSTKRTSTKRNSTKRTSTKRTSTKRTSTRRTSTRRTSTRQTSSPKKIKKCVSTKSNTKLWNNIVASVKKGNKGGPPNKWSARKSQISVKLYKKKGGKYIGKKNKCNSLTKWSLEKWDYIEPDSNRYLPEKIRNKLTLSEIKDENKIKYNNIGKKIPYSYDVYKKMKKAHIF